MRLAIQGNTILRSIFLLNTLLSQAIIFNSKDTLQERPPYLLTRFLCPDISSFSCNKKASNKLICDECYISVFNDEEINTNSGNNAIEKPKMNCISNNLLSYIQLCNIYYIFLKILELLFRDFTVQRKSVRQDLFCEKLQTRR